MNCKRLMSKFLVFFVSVMVMLFGASESFAATVYMPGDSLGEFLYTEDITFVAQYKKIEPKECPAGKYFNGTELVDCSRGYYCPGGDLYDGTVEVGRYVCQNGMDCSEIGVIEQKKCETGFYCEAGIPNKCPADFQYSVEGSDSINDCYTVVEAGSYIAGVSGLVQCPAGSYCPGGMQVYYGDTAGRMLCEDLEYGNLTWNGNGLTGLGNVGPENCSASVVAGKFFDATAEKVVDCPVDTSSKYRTVSYEQAKNGRVLCEPCNEGYSTNGKTGASSCELVFYKVTLNANGGTIVGGSSANGMACSVESEDIVLPIPSKTGYAFKGWYQNSGLTGDSITHIAAGTCLSDYKLYAKWEAKTYVITLNHNGAEGGATSVVATYGELLPGAEMPTMEGHVFKGYYSEPEGGTQYYNMLGNPVKEWDIDSAMILYAQWISDGNCEPGMYYDTDERKVKLCPAGSYCPGGEVDGVTCPKIACYSVYSDYPNSFEGASREGQCYKEVPRCWCTNDTATCEAKGANYCLWFESACRQGGGRMRLISCYIEGYGAIAKKEYFFGEGITAFCQENGTGKTTLASFIKAMFYGLKGYTKSSTEFCDREHFYPFKGGNFGGNLTFLYNEKRYTIERFFGAKSTKGDTLKVYCDGELTDELGEMIGKTVFGVDEESFLRTAFITSEEIEIEYDEGAIDYLYSIEKLANFTYFLL